ncbi:MULTISPECIES: hypothetical protein [unclassified Brevibacterium]|uniref:DUF6941 family protein n=1 Tax=unclassified Brevibacterium TaxID=2614124 RepID=UPI001E6532F8|nr:MULTISPECIES: hypothetical protein [unclassified Brevibacterium]MCD1285251.1 hypothetical protein [Brevibacterium sp. CCUG 69071]MDK8434296.1 hypothetical protein [Brevibacterium sp. H-BE7]
MAELDYAYLADYATVSEGKITAVGASFTHMFTPSLPSQSNFSIAGRIRVMEQENPPEISIDVRAEKSQQHMEINGQIHPSPASIVYDGKVGILFTLEVSMEMKHAELVTVDISLGGEKQRRLAFELTTQPREAEAN